jgi:uroporphyrinogen III methyltransferase/synthase
MYTWLVFTSGVGVNVFFDYLVDNNIDIRALHRLKIACVGIKTEREVTKRGVKVDYRPAEYNGAALARGLAALLKNSGDEKLLIARAKDADADLTRILADAGVAFDDVPVYEKIKNIESVSAIVNTICANDIVTFTSSSAVEAVAEAAAESAAHIDLSTIKAVCIGEKTAAAARSRGIREVHVAAEATAQSMVEKIRELHKS